MLEELSIRDFAIIERVSIRFERGLNLLTGETGAGKSILIGALGFILGNKADTGIIRSGTEETLISATFDVSRNPDALAWLSARGISAEDGGVILRRGLKNTGRGSAYVQDVPVVRQDLLELASLLVEVHGQRDSQALLKKDRHRQILDSYAGIDRDLTVYGSLYADLCSKRRLLESMSLSEKERERDLELLRYAVEEIDSLKLVAGEEEALADEERLLSQYGKLFEALSMARELLSDQDGILGKLRKTRVQLEAAQAIDHKLAESSRRIEDAFYELEDVSGFLSEYAERTSFDPGRLEDIETRQAAIQKLRRKYGSSIADILSYRDDAVAKIERLENWAEDRAGLQAETDRLELEVHARAEKL